MIKGFVALLDHEKMGFPLTAYVDVALEHPRFEKGFVDDLEKLLGVQECHYLAGEYAYRLKVKAADRPRSPTSSSTGCWRSRESPASARRSRSPRRRNPRCCPSPIPPKKRSSYFAEPDARKMEGVRPAFAGRIGLIGLFGGSLGIEESDPGRARNRAVG